MIVNFLRVPSDTAPQDTIIVKKITSTPVPSRSCLFRATCISAFLTGTLILSGCQPSVTEDKSPAAEARAAAKRPAPISDSAAAYIKQFQPLYVTQMQSLQRRLQAEFESLQAADTPTNTIANTSTNSSTNTKASVPTDADATDTNAQTQSTKENAASTHIDTDAEINISTEVGERDLEVLKRVVLEPQEPEILSEAQIIERYQQAMKALYQPAAQQLNAQEIDTLLNITTLLPQLFEQAQIAERVSIKSPALARLIVQRQVGQQIEAQQALDMQQMKLTQKQEFEGLMTKFNETIEDYDKQIAKYEQTLEEFR